MLIYNFSSQVDYNGIDSTLLVFDKTLAFRKIFTDVAPFAKGFNAPCLVYG